nr:pentatricopeptide repeat protein AaPPR274 [Agave angustifolia]
MASAMRAFEAFKEKSGGFNMFACRSIIDVCGLCGDFLKSRSIFKELLAEKITPNIYVFNSLMNVNAHDLSYVLHVYKQMQNLGITMDMTSYNILLKACCKAKRVDLAQDIYKEIKHMTSTRVLKLDVITYSTMIKVLADAKMWQMALNIKEDMLLADVSPNIVTWSSLISAFANAGLVDRAIQMFDEMLMAGCEPNAQCCNILLDACVKSCQYDRAFRFFYSWKESGFKIFRTTKGILEVVPLRPTVVTFNILMKACGTDYFRAKALMDEMKTLGLSPNYISWSVLIDIYGTSQNSKGAMEAFRIMQGTGIKLDVVAYTTAIKACVENKKLKMAFSLFQEMKRYRLRPNWVTYSTLLRARRRYGSLHEVQQCLAIYQEMRKAGYSANDYYLKELIEEWCEGVIRSNQDRALTDIQKKHKIAHSKRPHGLLLEKVAAHLQKDVGDNQAIDIRGLTQVEARIVVLSVLWKIREDYRSAGKMVPEDMIIISGVGKEMSGSANHEHGVQLAIVKVLQDELGLDLITGYGSAHGSHAPSLVDDASNSAATQKIEPPNDYKHVARRPQDLGVLKVSKKSLCNWLQKREGT